MLRLRAALAAAFVVSCAAAQTEAFSPTTIPIPESELLHGAALTKTGSKPTIVAWGRQVYSWTIAAGGGPELLGSPGPAFGEGGCPVDVNLDGKEDLVLLEAPQGGASLGRMVWLEAPEWKVHEIDGGADFRDCLAATIHGRRGVLVVHHQMQVRFYMVPEDPRAKWPYREIYSIYTPSQQGGLLLADINDDGFTDILCGNYWIRSPEEFEPAWRLFAIDLWFEGPQSAMSRLALANISGGRFPDLIVSQADMDEARLAWFSKPDNPTGLWNEHRLEGTLGLRHPQALAAGDLDKDGRPEIVVGEMNGDGSRLILFKNEGARFSPVVIGKTSGLFRAWITDVDGDSMPDIVGVGPHSITWWRAPSVKVVGVESGRR